MSSNRGKGKAVQWLRDHANYQFDYCLIWPFASVCRGYGHFGYLGKSFYAHRFMCELVHGAPPSPEHEASHSCGRGHEACVNPRHLSWKTQSENQLDCRGHGTQAKNSGMRLSADMAAQIRDLRGVKLQREVAEQFGVSESTVSDIWLSRTHASTKINHWTPEEDFAMREAIKRGKNFTEIANEIGRPRKAVESRAYRVGLHSGVPSKRPLSGTEDRGG